jgi:hypothetical protein
MYVHVETLMVFSVATLLLLLLHFLLVLFLLQQCRCQQVIETRSNSRSAGLGSAAGRVAACHVSVVFIVTLPVHVLQSRCTTDLENSRVKIWLLPGTVSVQRPSGSP